jgi:outer membrane protein assembly factor BamD (BamD/ComL family)
LDPFLEEVAALIQQTRFQEARQLLVAKRRTLPEGPELGAIEQAMQELERAEDAFLKHRIDALTEDKTAEQQVARLLEDEKYEEAIRVIESAEKEKGSTRDLDALKEQAVSELINKERNRAARFFLAAKQAGDPEKKMTYLRSSYDILKGILDKYPSSTLTDRVEANLKKVTEEMERLGKPPREG